MHVTPLVLRICTEKSPVILLTGLFDYSRQAATKALKMAAEWSSSSLLK